MPADRFDAIWLLIVVVVSLFFPLGAAIGNLRFSFWLPLEPEYEAWPYRHIPRDLARMVADLEDLGFIVRGRWEDSGFSNGTSLVTLAEHPDTHDTAQVSIFVGGKKRVVTTSFHTRFEDRQEVGTTNVSAVLRLPADPNITSVWLPEVREPGPLYSAHAQICGRLGAEKKRLPVGRDAERFLLHWNRTSRKYYVKAGYFFRVQDDIIRPTWKGAILTALKLFWPVQPFYRAWRRHKTRKILQACGVSVGQDSAPDRIQSRSGAES